MNSAAVLFKISSDSFKRLPIFIQKAGVKYYPPPPNYDHLVLPEKGKLRHVDRVPPATLGHRPPKMIKNLQFMRGPEIIHNKLIHGQYGVVALGGGRMLYGHFEMVRLTLGRRLDFSRMAAMWRIDPPWQPVTRKGQGHRMGGGKGGISHYVTPIKAHRVIVEVYGKCEYDEVKKVLTEVANKLPFKALPVSQKILNNMSEETEKEINENINPYTFEYLVKNNIQNTHRWIRRIDHFHFGKYV